jgi:hypothetical protein
MKWNLTKIAIVIAVVAVVAPLWVCAQTQPKQKQAPPPYTLATASYNLLIASGFLCDNADGCPAVAQAGDGETIDISGAGRLDLAQKSVTAAGAFTEKTAAGAISITGVWTSVKLVSFQPYGIAPFALLRDYPQLRTVGMSSLGRPMMPGFMMGGPMGVLMAGPLAAGGLAVIRIRLLPDAGAPQDALLSINCAQGKAPEQAQTDSVKVTITGGVSFDLQVTGRTVFLLQRPMPNFARQRATNSQAQ